MRNRSPSEISLKNAVLLSNAIPKSGSSLLFGLQQEFLYGVSGKKDRSYDVFKAAGIQMSGSWVSDASIPELATYLRNTPIVDGPYVLKLHCEVSGDLLESYIDCPNIFLSLIVRDPVEILVSARDNFLRSGEFQDFENLDQGIEVINTWYRRIYDSSVAAGERKKVPIVRYEDLVRDNIGTMLASLHPTLQMAALKQVAEAHTHLESAYKTASIRLNKGGERRIEDDLDARDLASALSALTEFRALLKYGSD